MARASTTQESKHAYQINSNEHEEVIGLMVIGIIIFQDWATQFFTLTTLNIS